MARKSPHAAEAPDDGPLDLVTGPLLRAIGSLSADSLVPGKAARARRPRAAKLRVPLYYFADGRDRLLPTRRALTYGHKHAAIEVAVPVSGSLLLVVDGEPYRMGPPDLAVLAPGMVHFETCGSVRRPYSLLWLVLTDGVCSMHLTVYAAGAGFSTTRRAVIGTMGPALRELAAVAGSGCVEPERVRDLRTALLAIASRAARFLSGGRFEGDETASRAVRRAQEFIRSRYLDKISVADAAQAANLSPNYLSALFREATGRTVLESIHELKLSEARTRLRETDTPVKRIAYDLGFESPHYFSRFFRQATGQTPSGFRAGEPAGE
jgi:AraC-like DNA-binding protein